MICFRLKRPLSLYSMGVIDNYMTVRQLILMCLDSNFENVNRMVDTLETQAIVYQTDEVSM